MRDEIFVTDIALESAENVNLSAELTRENVGFGIEKRCLNVKTKEMAERVGKPMGVYVNFDCDGKIYSNLRAAKAIETNLANSLRNMLGNKMAGTTLIACLGNGNIAADSLGEKVFDKLTITRKKNANLGVKRCVCAVSTSVLGKTGIESAELISAVCKQVKPSCVIAVDSLATSSPRRVGLSFQLTSAGITPGSGVGGDKARIDKSVLGVPVVAVGVPTLLSLGTFLYATMKDYSNAANHELDEYKFRSVLAERLVSNLVVAPKDIDVYVENASVVISNALNLALN